MQKMVTAIKCYEIFPTCRLLLDRSKSVPTIHAQPSTQVILRIDETPRAAVRKRQSARICSEYENQELADKLSEAEESQSWEGTADSKPAMITRGTQTRKLKPEFKRPLHRSKGIQTCLEEDVEPLFPVKRKRAEVMIPDQDEILFAGNESSESDSSDDELMSDSDNYDPETDSEIYDSESEAELVSNPVMNKFEAENESCYKEPKYIVFHNQLLLLLSVCFVCCSKHVVVNYATCGSMLTAYIKCLYCKTVREWKSQPDIAVIPMGNILLSGAILFSGSLPSKFLGSLRSIGIKVISNRTFFRHQKQVLHKVVANTWITQRNRQFIELQGTGIVVGGDGRCDSMGHSAKYGSYTTMNIETNKILNVEIVQCNQVKSSNHMELKGLQETLQLFEKFKVRTKSLVTDRHKQIAKWLKDHQPGIKHYFDCWHIAKSIKKRIQSLAKKKACELIGSWMKSIINHFYWSVMSTNIDNKDLIAAKWRSMLRHTQNIHDGHGELFPACSHAQLTDQDEREIKWFKPDSELADGFQKIVENKSLLKDIQNASPHGQTSGVEGYHSVVNHFAPKMFHFSFDGMKSRLTLAAMHYNENSGRSQQRNKQGALQYAIAFPKYKKGGYIVRKILSNCTYNYVETLFKGLIENLQQRDSNECVDESNPPPLCSSYAHPDKTAAVKEHTSRFFM